MSICEECKNLMRIKVGDNKRVGCIYSGMLSTNDITECSHFKQKTVRKDFEPKKQEVLSKGDEPRNRQS